jgi:protein TonB
MFEHYLSHHRPDRGRRLRMVIAAHLAGIATFSGLGFTWLMGKLQIAQVAPPSSTFVLVQMSLDTPLPPPIPPAPKLAEPQEKVEPEEPDDEVQPEDVSETLPPPPKPKAGPVGNGPPTATGTAPFGVPGVGVGIPGVNRIPGFIPIGTSLIVKPQKQESRPPVPLSVVRSQAIYSPDPDRNKLAATRAGMFDKRPGENETAFCVDAAGRTTDVRTVKAFPSDPQVDEVIRATIKTWRFRPFMVEGKAMKTCTSQVFRISFK